MDPRLETARLPVGDRACQGALHREHVRYLLGGYYGMRNVGDDVLLYVTLAEVARVDREASFTIISKLPEAIPAGTRVTIKPGPRRFGSIRDLMSHHAWLFGGGGLLQDGGE